MNAEVASPPRAEAGPDEQRHWQRLREHADPAAREWLLRLHLPYARIVAATYYARRQHDEIEFDDYLQLATLGLIESLPRYEPGRGASFRTFAARRMHGAILDGLAHMTERQQQLAERRRMRRERLVSLGAEAGSRAQDPLQALAELGIGFALGLMLEGSGMFDAGDEAAAPAAPAYQRLEFAQRVQELRASVDTLGEPQRGIITRHYLHGHGFDEIALALGLSRPRVSQLHRGALGSLRASLAASPACDLSF